MKYYLIGFYDSEIHTSIPEAAVEVTTEDYLALLDAQSQGATIVPDENGYPIAQYPAGPTFDKMQRNAISQLWANYKAFQTVRVDAEDLVLATSLAAAGSEKGTAMQAWVMSLWATYYTIKDQIEGATTTDELGMISLVCTVDEPPYTIRELNDEAMSALS